VTAGDLVIGAVDLRQSVATRLGYGYVLARACWGQGLMTEALAEVVPWALREHGPLSEGTRA
jgi:RimJ/RimL family protein N-acetyltransferase